MSKQPAAGSAKGEVAKPSRPPYISQAFEKVPEIGKGFRWYDLPYRALHWLQYSWPKKVLPRRWRLGLNYLTNVLIPFNEHDRNKVWSLEDP